VRRDCQFHWHNRDYQDFDQFLSTLKSKKRKNIRQERARVMGAGIHFEAKTGSSLTPVDIGFVFECYCRTFLAHGNYPALTRDFFVRLATEMPDSLVVVLAIREGKPVAMSLYLRSSKVLYGRYWGATVNVPGLHFETAYYQGMEFAIRHGITRFESGAQGEHKIARGFEPATTRSLHHIEHPAFRQAIARYLEEETDWMSAYHKQVQDHQPFRAESLD